MQTGEDEIAVLIDELRSLGFVADGSALDFGCGVGRLSIPLSKRFAKVIGVDIAPTMVELARSFAVDRPNIDFIVNDRPDLARWPARASTSSIRTSCCSTWIKRLARVSPRVLSGSSTERLCGVPDPVPSHG